MCHLKLAEMYSGGMLFLITSACVVHQSQAQSTPAAISNSSTNLVEPGRISSPSHSTTQPASVSLIVKIEDVDCKSSSQICADSYKQYYSDVRWKKYCFFDRDRHHPRACSEICNTGGRHHPLCYIINCPDYNAACPDTSGARLRQWVHNLTCDASDESCQLAGLERTKFFNISCYWDDRKEKFESCYQICSKADFSTQAACKEYCWEDYRNYCGSYMATTPALTSTPSSPTTKDKKSNHGLTSATTTTTAADYEITTLPPVHLAVVLTLPIILVVTVLVIVLVLVHKCRRRRATADGRTLARQYSKVACSCIRNAFSGFVQRVWPSPQSTNNSQEHHEPDEEEINLFGLHNV